MTRPIITVDLDGVVSSPPFGRNVGISRTFLDPAAPPDRALVLPRWLSAALDDARFDLRRPLADAREGLAQLHELRRVVLLTGRRTHPDRWLRRHHLAEVVHDVHINRTSLRSAHFKLEAIAALGAREHIDDDPRTAQLLAQRAGVRVYLRDWARNRDLPYAPNVVRVRDLRDCAQRVRTDDSAEARDT